MLERVVAGRRTACSGPDDLGPLARVVGFLAEAVHLRVRRVPDRRLPLRRGDQGGGRGAAALGGGRSAEQAEAAGADVAADRGEVTLEGGVTTARDDVEHRVAPDPLHVDARLRQLLGRLRVPPDPRLQVRAPAEEARHQPEGADDEQRRCQRQADVEHALGAPGQPPLRPVEHDAGDDREQQRDDDERQPGRLAAGRREHVVLLVEDGLGGGQQVQVRFLRRYLDERAAGERVAERVRAPGLRHVTGVDGQVTTERGERGARHLILAAGRAQPGQLGRGGGDVALVDPQRRQRRLGAGQEHRGGGHVGVRDGHLQLLRVQAERFVHGRHRARGGGVHAGHPAAERAPGQREQDQRGQHGPHRGRRRDAATPGAAAGLAGSAAAGACPVAGAAARGGTLLNRGGHEPISAICAWPSATSDADSGWNPTVSRYAEPLPAVITQVRKALIALAWAASRWWVLTTAYS